MSAGTAASLWPAVPQLTAFVVASLVLNATPGVDFLLTVSRTVSRGWRAGFAAVCGICAGCVVHALAAGFGLAALLTLHPGAFRAVQWLGAAYLAWLGLMMLRHALRSTPVEAPATGAVQLHAPPGIVDFRAGLLTNVLNPKVGLFFLAFVPQFVPASSPRPTLSFLLLSAVFVSLGFVFLVGLIAVATRVRQLRATAWVRRLLQGVGGVAFLSLAARIASARTAVV